MINLLENSQSIYFVDKLGILAIIGTIVVFGLVVYFLLTSVNMTDFITQFTIILIPIGLGFLGFVFRKKFVHTSQNNYEPNHQEYWNHIEKIRKSLETEFNGQTNPNFYDIIRKSPKKREIFQHLVTYFTFDTERVNRFLEYYIGAHSAEKNLKQHNEITKIAISEFNKEFRHIYEIMSDSKPLLGMCDGCKMDYVGQDTKRCLKTLKNFNEDKKKILDKL